MKTDKVTRIEVIDHTKEVGGGRVHSFWSEYHQSDIKNPKVELAIQDGGRTLKILIEQS